MMKTGTCPKCGSGDVMADVEVRDDGRSTNHPLRVAVVEPEPAEHAAVWVQRESTGDLIAHICAHCGYTELYTANLSALWKSYQKRR
jgi:predicted nucleic-acid-binding Zn-ribbon protein